MLGNLPNVPAEYNQKLIMVSTEAGNPWFFVGEGALPTLGVTGVNRVQGLAQYEWDAFVVPRSSVAYASMYAPCCTDVSG
jgi:hypothetical protein